MEVSFRKELEDLINKHTKIANSVLLADCLIAIIIFIEKSTNNYNTGKR